MPIRTRSTFFFTTRLIKGSELLRITFILLVSAFLCACNSNLEQDSVVNSIIDSLDQSSETDIVGKPIVGEYFNVRIKSRGLDHHSYLLVRCKQLTGYYDYRYEIQGDTLISVFTPFGATTIQLGIVRPTHLVPRHASISVVYNSTGDIAEGVLASIVDRANSYDDALHIGKLALSQGSTEALYWVLKGALASPSKGRQVLRLIDSTGRTGPAQYREVQLAALCMMADEDALLNRLKEYLTHCNSSGIVRYPVILEDVLSIDGLSDFLTVDLVNSLLAPLLSKHSLWLQTRSLAYSTSLSDSGACSVVTHLASAYLHSMSNLTDYDNVSQASLKFTFAEIARASGNRETANSLLQNVFETTSRSSSRYWNSSKDYYWVVDVAPWPDAAIIRLARWYLTDGKDREALSYLSRYAITEFTSMGLDADAIRIYHALSVRAKVDSQVDSLVEQLSRYSSKAMLRDTIAKYFPTKIVARPIASVSAVTELVMISGSSCGVCTSILKSAMTVDLGRKRAFTIYNSDTRSIEYSKPLGSVVTLAQLQALAQKVVAYPTLFVLRNGLIERTYSGTSFDQVRMLCAE